jgi:DNA polymerase-3 subunit delta
VTETAVFAMTDELTAGRYDRASQRLNDLLQAKEEPVTLLALLAKQLRGLYAAKLASKSGKGEQAVADVMGYRSTYPARKLMDAAQRLTLPWCREAVTLASQTDRQLKTSAVDREDALPFLLARLAVMRNEC